MMLMLMSSYWFFDPFQTPKDAREQLPPAQALLADAKSLEVVAPFAVQTKDTTVQHRQPPPECGRSSKFVRRQAHDSGRLSRVPGWWCWQPPSECCDSRCPQSGHVMTFNVERTELPAPGADIQQIAGLPHALTDERCNARDVIGAIDTGGI